jgi:ribulose-bisphosphate carboxylase small chain
MNDIRDYPGRLGDPASTRLGTFSYLPPFDAAEIRTQAAAMVARGWSCAIEHVEPARAITPYWYLWKLPMFGERDVDTILHEVTACRTANPTHHVRLLGYDPIRQTQGLAMVVARGPG